MTKRTILKERRYKAGYVVRTELVDGSEFEMKDFEVKSAYTPQGDYIGDLKTAYHLCAKRGIAPEISPATNCDGAPMPCCSIGLSEREQKWYGWSHRAFFGFGIGSEAKEGDCVTTSGWTAEYLAEHPEANISVPVGFKAKTLDDAKRMAIAFAESVG